MPSTKVFLCLIGVIILVTEATGNDEVECSGSATLLTTSPGLDMALCKDTTQQTCEKDFESLCPAGWNLCTPGQFNNRNDGWNYNWLEAEAKPLGVIYCYRRAYAYDGDVPINFVTEARHYGPLGPSYGRQRSDPELSADVPLQCESASSRPGCTYWSNYNHDCNEQEHSALCCAKTRTCGDGLVQEEEDCDDGNDSNMDECMNTCTWKEPRAHGLNGC